MAGVIDIDASDKMARLSVFFLRRDQHSARHVVDSPGFLPGTGQEHGGIIAMEPKSFTHTRSDRPKISLVTRKAYGGAYIVMASKLIRTTWPWPWPTAEIAVMGAEGRVTFSTVKNSRNARAKKRRPERAAAGRRVSSEIRRPYPPLPAVTLTMSSSRAKHVRA